VGDAVGDADVERHRRVDRHVARLVAESIGVPEGKDIAVAREPGRLLAEGEVAGAGAVGDIVDESAIEGPGPERIMQKLVASRIAHDEPNGMSQGAHLDSLGGGDDDRIARVAHRGPTERWGCIARGERMRGGESGGHRVAEAHAHAHTDAGHRLD